eukprot:124003-Chlamydomonas_euryale.AAC.6
MQVQNRKAVVDKAFGRSQRAPVHVYMEVLGSATPWCRLQLSTLLHPSTRLRRHGPRRECGAGWLPGANCKPRRRCALDLHAGLKTDSNMLSGTMGMRCGASSALGRLRSMVTLHAAPGQAAPGFWHVHGRQQVGFRGLHDMP